MIWDVRKAFEPGGIIAQHFDGYEMREPQVELATTIERCLKEGKHLAAEGPPGVGKSVSYLVPTIFQIKKMMKKAHEAHAPENENEFDMDTEDSGDRVVVATANIALQEQLYTKDLPMLNKIIPGGVRFAMVKGRNNYLCRQNLEDMRLQAAQRNLKFGQDASQMSWEDVQDSLTSVERIIVNWAQSTETGDKSDLSIEPDSWTWSKFSVTAADCLGSECKKRGECFAEKARAALRDMDVIVVNYHLLFAAIKVRAETTKNIVIPPFKYLVCDEAHKIADIARAFFGWEISPWMMPRLIAEANRAIDRSRGEFKSEEVEIMDDNVAAVHGAHDRFVEALGKMHKEEFGSIRLRSSDGLGVVSLGEALGAMGTDLGKLASVTSGQEKLKTSKASARCLELRDQLFEFSELVKEQGGNNVYFIDRAGKQKACRLVKRMLKVDEILWAEMFSKTTSTVITSATMAIEGDCGYVRREVGMREGIEKVVESPFNHREQACIVLSKNAPDPKADNYQSRVAAIMKKVIEDAGGRTLGLFTSYRVLRYAAEYLRKELPQFNILVQGDTPRMQLVKLFKEDIKSVLLGTESCWAGVDVPGEALSCLIIDKIPFPAPGDPVLDALSEQYDGMGGFWQVSVPRAVLQFRQGVGRLIRKRDDRGIIVVLDNRLVTKGYGSIFVRSIPRMTRAHGISNGQVAAWLDPARGQ